MRQQALQRGQRHAFSNLIGEQAAEANRQQQQRLRTLRYRQPQQQAHQQHDGTACAKVHQPMP